MFKANCLLPVLMSVAALLCDTANANRVGALIDEDKLLEEKETLTLKEVVDKYGRGGCLGGQTVMTYQFRNRAGDAVWFWLKNEPIPAGEAIQRAAPEVAGVEVLMIVRKSTSSVVSSPEAIIWPKSLVGKSTDDVMDDAYFSKYRRKP